jgi:transcriptional regulator with XRE-family HTH domain
MKPGRKNAYDTKIKPRLFEIAGWARDGYTDKDMCAVLGVSVSTFSKYKAEKSELMEALKEAKAIADLTVENSLYQRANGFEYEETVQEIKTDSEGNVREKHIKKTTKTVLPDTTAQIFWLKNRQPKKWRDKQQIEHTGKDGGPIRHRHNAESAIEEMKRRGLPIPDID